MKENRKRVFRDFRYMECGAFADYLHAMSLEGWHFISWKFGLIFEKGEPEDIVYAVEVFPKAVRVTASRGKTPKSTPNTARRQDGGSLTGEDASVYSGGCRTMLFLS